MEKLEFFALDKNFELAQNIAHKYNKDLIIPEVVHFADTEVRIELPDDIDLKGKEAFIIHSTVEPVNQDYMELFFLIDLLKRKGASKINILIPYFGYSRQCGCKKSEDIGHSKIIAKLLECCGASSLASVEIHDSELEDFFTIPFKNILLREFIAQNLKKLLPDYKQWCLVAPDAGARDRVKEVAKLLGIDTILFSKKRTGVDQLQVLEIESGACKGKNVIILDDILATGKTAVKVATRLHEQGVAKVYGFFIHPVIANEAIKRVQESAIEKIFVTNTVALKENEKIDKIEVLDISDEIEVF